MGIDTFHHHHGSLDYRTPAALATLAPADPVQTQTAYRIGSAHVVLPRLSLLPNIIRQLRLLPHLWVLLRTQVSDPWAENVNEKEKETAIEKENEKGNEDQTTIWMPSDLHP